jgi:hypothetical protein
MAGSQRSRRGGVAAAALGVLMVACCLAAPLLAGAVATLTVGSLFGLAAAAVVLVAACLYAGLRLTSGGRC